MAVHEDRERDDERDEATLTSAVVDHGNRRTDGVERRTAEGGGEWRADEEGETDTPENTGSKVGPGREAS